ncbi:MAG: Alpha-acetolactate decarboxylase [uncultured Solirubrobacterales bacterium]|uniref:Alpha-acetolactate decarboxylase n=1 Tax=uncultured Solirubrobacterales bacterium TaxID=768556 RepID=A0A6J4SJ28_9ACTN|nr:MAG: Alpha-acetolactate decarboxylase [uncultured Solirubrobacterales bacterium]
MIDERLARALHVQTIHHAQLAPEHEPHVLFQASTIGALLEGAYEGDVTFAELAQHGDLGLGTLNALDGEMIAVDGCFYRADLDGRTAEIDPERLTPFAVVVAFAPTVELSLDGPLDQSALLAALDRALPTGTPAWALRVDGDFGLVRARSVPRQRPPYKPLTEVVAEQRVFELHDVRGTLVGFRFPEYSGAIEISGFHLHFISDDRRRGGHVLDCRPRTVTARIDPSTDLHLELPPGVNLSEPHLDLLTEEAVRRVEHQG